VVSSSWIDVENADWETKHFAAACPKCVSSQSATKYRSWRMVGYLIIGKTYQYDKKIPFYLLNAKPYIKCMFNDTRENIMDINIGIDRAKREEIADHLSTLLADSYSLYLKTHNFHWNVTGPLFNTLHAMFEQQYTELAVAVDDIAERIRALGVKAPGSYREFGERTSIPEANGDESAEDMIRALVEGQEAVVRTARQAFPTADSADDEPTADLLTQRMQVHEKNAWMLRSMLAA
jgi:starvation-inducible DNA-binding protein